MIDECDLLASYGETCETVTGGLPLWGVIGMTALALAVVAVFRWAGATGRLGDHYRCDHGPNERCDRYCDHEYDSYCGLCGLAVEED